MNIQRDTRLGLCIGTLQFDFPHPIAQTCLLKTMHLQSKAPETEGEEPSCQEVSKISHTSNAALP